MHRINSLTSPRSKPISEYTRQLKHIISKHVPTFFKQKLLEGLLSEIQYKIHCLKTPKLKAELSIKLEEELLWKEIQRMEICIMKKRLQKQQMENNLCLYQQQLLNIQQISQIKKDIRNSLQTQVSTIKKKNQILEGQTLVSLGDTSLCGETNNSFAGGLSIQSCKSQRKT